MRFVALVALSSCLAFACAGQCTVGETTCYADAKPGQGGMFVSNPFKALNQMRPASLEECASICWQHKLPLAGAEYGNECYCGSAIQPSVQRADSNKCSMPCGSPSAAQTSNEKCGGMFYITVFNVNCSGPPPTPQPAQPFNNVDLPLDTRLDDLLARLTESDLINQLGGPGIGDILRPNLTLPGTSYGRECLSGVDSITIPVNKTGTTAFPNPVNLGMTFDVDLVEAVGSAIGDEVPS